jgi:hypothetical protein
MDKKKDICCEEENLIDDNDLSLIFKIAGVMSGALIFTSISLSVCCYLDSPFSFMPVILFFVIGGFIGSKASYILDKFI